MRITIDGKPCECERGEFLLDIARRNGIFIPTLCHHEGLPGQGSCRVCIAEVVDRSGWARVVTSCVFPVEKECDVYTASEKILSQRKMIYALLASRAPEGGTGGERPAPAAWASSSQSERPAAPPPERFTRMEGEKCVLCGLCVRACESVGTGAISTVNRGTDKKVSTPYDDPSWSCIGCATCAGVCPTGAIAVEEKGGTRTIWGRKFELIGCENCGEVFGTKAEVAYAAKGNEPERLCGRCRKKAMAEVMAGVYGAG